MLNWFKPQDLNIQLTDGTIQFFDMVKELGEGQTNDSIRALFESVSGSLGTVNDGLEDFIDECDPAGDLMEQFTERVGHGESKLSALGKTVKGVAANIGIMLAVSLAIKGAMWVFDQLYTSFEEQQEIVDELTDKIKGLQEEYDNLKDDPSASSTKLNYLKQRIEYEKDLLDIQKERLALKDIEENMPEVPSEKTGVSGGTVNPTYTAEDTVETNVQNNLKKLQQARTELEKLGENTDGWIAQTWRNQEDSALESLQDNVETLKEQYTEYADAKEKLEEYINDGTLKGVNAEKAKARIAEYQAEIDRLDPIILNADLNLGTAHFTQGYDTFLDDIQSTAYVQDNLSIEGMRGSEMSTLIDDTKQLNEALREGTITSKEWFESLNDLMTSGSFDDAIQRVDDWSTDKTDELEAMVATMSAQIGNGLNEASSKFLRGDSSVSDYIDELQAGSDAQLTMLKSLNKLTIGEDGFAETTENASDEVQAAVNDYNNLKDATDELEDVQGLADVLSSDFDFFKDYKSWTEDMLDSQDFQAHINELSSGIATFLQEQPEMVQSFADMLQQTTGETIDTSMLLAENASSYISSIVQGNLSSTTGMVDWTMNTVGQVVGNASQAIGDVLSALGKTISGFSYSIEAKPYLKGSLKKLFEIEKDGSIKYNGFPSFGVDFTGKAKGGAQDLGSALTKAGEYFRNTGNQQLINQLSNIDTYGNKTAGKSGATSPTDSPDTGKKPTSKTPSSGSKGSKGSGSKDKYTADIDKYKELSDAVENVKDKINELNDAYDATDNIDEQISLKNVLIGLYKDEQDALEKLNKARDKEISDNVAQLRQKGFKIDYDAQTDTLVIKNREYLNKLSQSTIKDTESLIKSTEELNDKNRESLSTWKELNYKISDVNKAINELKHTQYENNVADQEHLIELLSNRKDAEGMDVSIYKELMNSTFTEWYRLVKQGYQVNKETIQDMEKAWKDYYDKRLESEKEILEKQKESKDNALSAIIDLIDDQIKGIDDEIDAMKKLNDERQKALTLQQRQADLDKANSQKTNKVLTKDKGWVYKADEDAIREAEQALADAKFDKRVSDLEKEKEKLEEYKNMWEELPDLFDKQQNRLLASEQLGANWERNVLDQRLDVYNRFKDGYLGVQQDIKDKTDELEQHLSATYVNMMKVFELMYKINTPKNEDHDSWYVQKNGKAPSQAKKGDFIYTNGGTYRITGKDANGNFTREKVDDVNSHIKENLWGTKLPKEVVDSVSGITESNQKIVDAADKQVQEDKRQLLATQGLNAILGTNGKITNENITSLLENIISTDDNTKSNEQVADELRTLANAIANFSLVDEEEDKKITLDNFDDRLLSDSDRAYIKSLQQAWNDAMAAGNKELADRLHEIANDVRSKYIDDYNSAIDKMTGKFIDYSDAVYNESGTYNIGGKNADAEATKKYLDNLQWMRDKATETNPNTGSTWGSKDLLDRLDRIEDVVRNGDGLTSTVYTDNYGRTYTETKENGTKISSNAPSAGSKKTDSLSKSDATAIKAAQKAYNEAKAKGDTNSMNKAHAEAEAIRNKNGYSGGDDGSKVIASSNKDVSKNLKDNSKNIEKNSDTHEDNTKATEDNTKQLAKGINVNVSVSGGGSSGGGRSSGGSGDSESVSGKKYASVSNSDSSGGYTYSKGSDGLVHVKDKSGKTVGKYAKGGLNLPADIYNVNEKGDEIVLDKPDEGNWIRINTGGSVIPHYAAKNMWEFGANPKMFLSDMLGYDALNMKSQMIYMAGSGETKTIVENHFHDMHIHDVKDANEFVQQLSTLPAYAEQHCTSRTRNIHTM